MPETFDVVVIGSGFGGAITAARLAANGYKTVVLERGRRWTPESFPRQPTDAWLWDHRRPAQCNGWFDFRVFPNMAVVQGAGVGGGSLVYANISVNAKTHMFEKGWPPEITVCRARAALRRRRRDARRAEGAGEPVARTHQDHEGGGGKEPVRRSVPAARPCGALRSGMALRPAGAPRGNPRQDEPQRARPGAGHVRAPR